MELWFHGNIGSDEKLPFHYYRFTLEEDAQQLKLMIDTTEKLWFQILLWDPLNRLVLQHLHLYKRSRLLLGVGSDCTYTSSCSNGLMKGDYILGICGITESEQVEYGIDLLPGAHMEGAEAQESLVEWTKGMAAEEGLLLDHYDLSKIAKEGFGWYKGDFHTHTTISDGKQTPPQLMLQAEKQGLDFFVTTEHNLLPTRWLKGQVLVLPGMELTERSSHFNAIGLTKWMDFRPDQPDGGLASEVGMNRLMRQTRENGAICSINHPFLKPWEWLYRDVELAHIDSMEIINDPTFPHNKQATEKALALWNLMWQQGCLIWGIGGSDSHMLPSECYDGAVKPSLIGDPATYVLCNGLSAVEVIHGVRRGRVYVSRGPRLFIEIRYKTESYYPGDNLTELFRKQDNEDGIHYHVKFSGLLGKGTLVIVENGMRVSAFEVLDEEVYVIPMQWRPGEYCWSRLELRAEDGELLLFTNPVYSGTKPCKLKTWGQLVDLLEEQQDQADDAN